LQLAGSERSPGYNCPMADVRSASPAHHWYRVRTLQRLPSTSALRSRHNLRSGLLIENRRDCSWIRASYRESETYGRVQHSSNEAGSNPAELKTVIQMPPRRAIEPALLMISGRPFRVVLEFTGGRVGSEKLEQADFFNPSEMIALRKVFYRPD